MENDAIRESEKQFKASNGWPEVEKGKWVHQCKYRFSTYVVSITKEGDLYLFEYGTYEDLNRFKSMEDAIHEAWKYMNRLWNQVDEDDASAKPATAEEPGREQ